MGLPWCKGMTKVSPPPACCLHGIYHSESVHPRLKEIAAAESRPHLLVAVSSWRERISSASSTDTSRWCRLHTRGGGEGRGGGGRDGCRGGLAPEGVPDPTACALASSESPSQQGSHPPTNHRSASGSSLSTQAG